MKISNLSDNEYNPYYGNYIKLVDDLDLIESLQVGLDKTIAFLKAIPKDKLEYRYAEDKWTIKEIIQHIIDTERIFCYRALRFARCDKASLPGFDQDEYIAPSYANNRSLESFIEEYKAVRHASITLFKSLSDEMLKEIGEASGNPMSARAAGFVISGHETHHCHVIKTRYL